MSKTPQPRFIHKNPLQAHSQNIKFAAKGSIFMHPGCILCGFSHPFCYTFPFARRCRHGTPTCDSKQPKVLELQRSRYILNSLPTVQSWRVASTADLYTVPCIRAACTAAQSLQTSLRQVLCTYLSLLRNRKETQTKSAAFWYSY